MADEDNTPKDTGSLFTTIRNYIVSGAKWFWEYSYIVVCVVLFVNIFILVPVNLAFALINFLVLVLFALRLWKEYKENG